MKKFMGLMIVLAMGAAACTDNGNGSGGGGGGGGNDFHNAQAEETASNMATGTAESFTNMKDSPSGDAAIAAVFGTYANAFLIASATNQVAGTKPASEGVEVPSAGPQTLLPACVQSTANQVTWDNCDFGTYQIDGTVSTSGNDITVDLTVTAAGVANSFTGTITATPTLLDGTLHVESVVASVGFSVDITFDSIGITSGCPTSGSLTVDPSFTGNGIRSVTATFGPNCGDVQLSD